MTDCKKSVEEPVGSTPKLPANEQGIADSTPTEINTALPETNSSQRQP